VQNHGISRGRNYRSCLGLLQYSKLRNFCTRTKTISSAGFDNGCGAGKFNAIYALTKLTFGKIQRYTLNLIFVNVNVNFQFNDAQLCAGDEDAELTVSSLLALSHQEEEGSADGDSLPPLGKVIRTIHKCRPLIPLGYFFILLLFLLCSSPGFHSQRMQ